MMVTCNAIASAIASPRSTSCASEKMFSAEGTDCREGGKGQFCWATAGHRPKPRNSTRGSANWRGSILRASLSLATKDAKRKLIRLYRSRVTPSLPVRGGGRGFLLCRRLTRKYVREDAGSTGQVLFH